MSCLKFLRLYHRRRRDLLKGEGRGWLEDERGRAGRDGVRWGGKGRGWLKDEG